MEVSLEKTEDHKLITIQETQANQQMDTMAKKTKLQDEDKGLRGKQNSRLDYERCVIKKQDLKGSDVNRRERDR